MPKRIQLKRTKGWRKPKGAVVVSRPSKWGNPWTHKFSAESGLIIPDQIPAVNAREFRAWLQSDDADESSDYKIYRNLAERRREVLRRLPGLRGKDLCCWCPLDKPCHADVLLELANAK